MKIVFKDYELQPEGARFNLVKKGKGKNKENQEIDTEKSMGYGLTFENCLRLIAADIISETDKTYTIPEYILEYKSVSLYLIEALK